MFFKGKNCKFWGKEYNYIDTPIPIFLAIITQYIIMKKFMLASIIMYSSLILVWYAQMVVPNSENYILNENDQQVLNTEGIDDPLRWGAYHIIEPVGWGTGIAGGVVGIGDKISTYEHAQSKTLNVIKNIINYALGMLGLVALIYLIYHGFLIVTAAGDDTQYKKWIKGIKFAAIAIAGIGASWLIISGIFRLIALIIWS